MQQSSIEKLMDVETSIRKEKEALRLINVKIIIYTVLMGLLIAFYQLFSYMSYDWIDSPLLAQNIQEVCNEGILLLNAIILAYSVWCIRQTIQTLLHVFPNESFIGVHLANSFAYAILYLILGAMAIKRRRLNKRIGFNPGHELILKYIKINFYYDLIFIIIIIFSVYMDLFLLYLVFRFTKRS